MAQIDRIRAFNRFYINQTGLLSRVDSGHLNLTEARVLYEVGSKEGVKARELTMPAIADSRKWCCGPSKGFGPLAGFTKETGFCYRTASPIGYLAGTWWIKYGSSSSAARVGPR